MIFKEIANMEGVGVICHYYAKYRKYIIRRKVIRQFVVYR